MASYIPEELLEKIELYKEQGDFDKAISVVNQILSKNPTNEEALLQVTDIQYRKGEIVKAGKAIDFLNTRKKHTDPLGLYIKGVLEMEKNQWKEAKKYLQKALDLTEGENHEILRCYGLCEYRYGNREKGVHFVENAFAINDKDAEVIYNLVELYLLEQRYAKATKMIAFYHKMHKNLQVVDKEISYYDRKITLFEKFIKTQQYFKSMMKKK